MTDTEHDAEGRIIGYGITFNPTPHHYASGGRTLYTWCALDTLALPTFIGGTAQVTSHSPAQPSPVSLMLGRGWNVP